MPLYLGDYPPGSVSGAGPVGEVVVEDLGLGRRPAHRAGHEVIYMFVELAVGLDPHGVEHPALFEVFIDIRGGEGGVGPEVELLSRCPVPVQPMPV